MTTKQAIEIGGLTKSYGGDHAVLRGVDLSVPSGTIFAQLGSNGAGKTTAVKILSTLLKADGGTAAVNGYDVVTQPAQVRESISLTGQFAPSTRSSPGGRTSCSSPNCDVSRTQAGSRTTCSGSAADSRSRRGPLTGV